MQEYIWAVSRSGLVPPRKHDIKKETKKTYVLDDGTIVKKSEMQNTYQLFFQSEASAETTYQMLKSVFDPEKTTNIVAIRGADADKMSDILFDMIQNLCEDGMPTKETIKDWLLSQPGCSQCDATQETNAIPIEDYSGLKNADHIYFVDFAHGYVKEGTVFGIRRAADNSITFLSVEFVDDFMGINGEFLGKELFISETIANQALERSKKCN